MQYRVELGVGMQGNHIDSRAGRVKSDLSVCCAKIKGQEGGRPTAMARSLPHSLSPPQILRGFTLTGHIIGALQLEMGSGFTG